MPGPVNVSAVAGAAVRVRPAPDAMRTVGSAFDRDVQSAVRLAADTPAADRPRVAIVGIGRVPPRTTQSLVEEAAARGLVPGDDIISTRYADLRVGRDRGFVRLAPGTGADGLVLAGQGRSTLFLFRGGGNLKEPHLRKIAAIQSVDGATALTDLSFIERAGSKAVTFERLKAAGLALPHTVPVRGAEAAVRAFDEVLSRSGSDLAVLKKVNSLGGKDVHFVGSHGDIRSVVARDPDAEFVLQEFLPHARDQDVRVHMVWNQRAHDFEVANAYVRNRNPFQPTPNLASGGYPTHYELSPWERAQSIGAARVLSEGSPHAPLHVGMDLFPRVPITASTVERNQRLSTELAAGRLTERAALEASRDTVVIGEAASSAGTKGTELVLGEGVNPVATRIIDEILHTREHGLRPLAAGDARAGARLLRSTGTS